MLQEVAWILTGSASLHDLLSQRRALVWAEPFVRESGLQGGPAAVWKSPEWPWARTSARNRRRRTPEGSSRRGSSRPAPMNTGWKCPQTGTRSSSRGRGRSCWPSATRTAPGNRRPWPPFPVNTSTASPALPRRQADHLFLKAAPAKRQEESQHLGIRKEWRCLGDRHPFR